MKTHIGFDMEAAIKDLREGKDLGGKDGIFTPLIKQLTEAAMQAELEEHLAAEAAPNRKNGSSTKTLSNGTISAVTDKLLPELQPWRERDLEAVYPIVWPDAIHYKIKENGRYLNKAVYTILGLNMEGKKELPGLYLSNSEGAHHWLSVLTDLHNRGVKDILIVWGDGLKGFPEAIHSIYPDTEIQHCIIHQIRHSMKYVASKNQSAFMADLKCVYKDATLNAAEIALDELEDKWGDKYPLVIQSWRRK